MKTNIRNSINSLNLPDIYSLMLFILYKVQDVPEYAVMSELCYLLDSNNITRLLTYFAGKTVTFPSEKEMLVLINALLMYQYVNIDGYSFVEAQAKLNVTQKQKQQVIDLYTKILPIINNYNIDRHQV